MYGYPSLPYWGECVCMCACIVQIEHVHNFSYFPFLKKISFFYKLSLLRIHTHKNNIVRTWAASASCIQNLILLHCHCCLFIRSTTWSTWNLLKLSSIQVNGEKCCIVSNWKKKWCCNHSKHTLKICAIRISSYFLSIFLLGKVGFYGGKTIRAQQYIW